MSRLLLAPILSVLVFASASAQVASFDDAGLLGTTLRTPLYTTPPPPPYVTSIVTNGNTVNALPFFFSSGAQNNDGLATVNTGPIDGGSTFGSGNYLRVNNINLGLALPSAVPGLSFEYAFLGGNSNININGTQLFNFGSPSTLTGTTVGGVAIAATSTPITGGQAGVVTLTGPISSFSVGGQEFFLDNIRIVPEPGSFAIALAGGMLLLRRRG